MAVGIPGTAIVCSESRSVNNRQIEKFLFQIMILMNSGDSWNDWALTSPSKAASCSNNPFLSDSDTVLYGVTLESL